MSEPCLEIQDNGLEKTQKPPWFQTMVVWTSKNGVQGELSQNQFDFEERILLRLVVVPFKPNWCPWPKIVATSDGPSSEISWKALFQSCFCVYGACCGRRQAAWTSTHHQHPSAIEYHRRFHEQTIALFERTKETVASETPKLLNQFHQQHALIPPSRTVASSFWRKHKCK